MESALVYGVRNGQLVHVNDVDSGISCECVCAGCGARLVAKKGKVKKHHFSHYDSEECANARESALHLAAKNAVLRAKRIMLPDHWIFGELIRQKEMIYFDHVLLESSEGGIRPDIQGIFKGGSIFIEIAVTHFVDDEKKNRIKEIGIPTLEVDLSQYIDSCKDLNWLENLVIDNLFSKKWIFCPEAEELKRIRYKEITKFMHTVGCKEENRFICETCFDLAKNGESRLGCLSLRELQEIERERKIFLSFQSRT